MLEIQQKRRYVAKTREMAFSEIKNEFGEDFVILYEKEIYEGGIFGFFATRKFEVMVGRLPVQKSPKPAVSRPEKTGFELPRTRKNDSNQDILEELLVSLQKKNGLNRSDPPTSLSVSPPEPNPQLAKYLAEALRVGTPNGLYQNPALGKMSTYKAGGLPVARAESNESLAEMRSQLREMLKEFGGIKKNFSQMEERLNSVVVTKNNTLSQTAAPLLCEQAVKIKEAVADFPVFDKFVSKMEDACFSKAIIKTYLNILKKECTEKEPTIEELCDSFRQKYLKTIEGKFKGCFLSEITEAKTDEEPADESVTPLKTPRVAVFVGPTGVGKTTTVVKYACSLLHKGKSVVLIAADTFKMGAVEQLQFFAEKMNMGFDVVYELEKLPEHIAQHQNADYILVDTVGRSPLSKGQLSRMQNSLPEELGAEVHLVISAVAKYQDMEKVVYGYRGFCADYLLFTKLDETCVYGPILSILQKWQRKVSCITNGQTVPGDICLCSEKSVNKLIFNDSSTPALLSV